MILKIRYLGGLGVFPYPTVTVECNNSRRTSFLKKWTNLIGNHKTEARHPMSTRSLAIVGGFDSTQLDICASEIGSFPQGVG